MGVRRLASPTAKVGGLGRLGAVTVAVVILVCVRIFITVSTLQTVNEHIVRFVSSTAATRAVAAALAAAYDDRGVDINAGGVGGVKVVGGGGGGGNSSFVGELGRSVLAEDLRFSGLQRLGKHNRDGRYKEPWLTPKGIPTKALGLYQNPTHALSTPDDDAERPSVLICVASMLQPKPKPKAGPRPRRSRKVGFRTKNVSKPKVPVKTTKDSGLGAGSPSEQADDSSGGGRVLLGADKVDAGGLGKADPGTRVIVDAWQARIDALQALIDRVNSAQRLRASTIVVSNADDPQMRGVDRWIRADLKAFADKTMNLLPSLCRPVLAQHAGRFDIYLYTEDDLAFEPEQIVAFWRQQQHWLRHNVNREVVGGQLLYERMEPARWPVLAATVAASGPDLFVSVSGDSTTWSVVPIKGPPGDDDCVYMRHPNLHQASFLVTDRHMHMMMTRPKEAFVFGEQLRRSVNYKVDVGWNVYDTAVSGLKRAICVARTQHFDDSQVASWRRRVLGREFAIVPASSRLRHLTANLQARFADDVQQLEKSRSRSSSEGEARQRPKRPRLYATQEQLARQLASHLYKEPLHTDVVCAPDMPPSTALLRLLAAGEGSAPRAGWASLVDLPCARTPRYATRALAGAAEAGPTPMQGAQATRADALILCTPALLEEGSDLATARRLCAAAGIRGSLFGPAFDEGDGRGFLQANVTALVDAAADEQAVAAALADRAARLVSAARRRFGTAGSGVSHAGGHVALLADALLELDPHRVVIHTAHVFRWLYKFVKRAGLASLDTKARATAAQRRQAMDHFVERPYAPLCAEARARRLLTVAEREARLWAFGCLCPSTAEALLWRLGSVRALLQRAARSSDRRDDDAGDNGVGPAPGPGVDFVHDELTDADESWGPEREPTDAG